MTTTFSQLNQRWNAEPNSPDPIIEVKNTVLRLSFTLNAFIFPFEEDATGTIEFASCWRYRLGPTNDEGWYMGQCRFSQLAPKWGEFYEVGGDVLSDQVSDWVLRTEPPVSESRHFLFYFRDKTFECDAVTWSVGLPPPRRSEKERQAKTISRNALKKGEAGCRCRQEQWPHSFEGR